MLWNDIEWPDGGKGHDDYALAALLRGYVDAVPDGVVNDRWGVPFHGFLTREYMEIDGVQDEVFEATRGLGFSFGYNQDEDARHCLSGAGLIRLLVDVVSKNGNLLINVGPRADGSIPELQLAAMRELGAWLRVNGEAVYGTRPWVRAGDPGAPALASPVAYTTTGGAVHAHALDPAVGAVRLPEELRGRACRWIGAGDATADGAEVPIPEALRGAAAAVLTVR